MLSMLQYVLDNQPTNITGGASARRVEMCRFPIKTAKSLGVRAVSVYGYYGLTSSAAAITECEFKHVYLECFIMTSVKG